VSELSGGVMYTCTGEMIAVRTGVGGPCVCPCVCVCVCVYIFRPRDRGR